MGVACVLAAVGIDVSGPEELEVITRAVLDLLTTREVNPEEEL